MSLFFLSRSHEKKVINALELSINGTERWLTFGILGAFFCYRLVGHHDLKSFIVFLIASAVAVSGQIAGHFMRNKVEKNAAYPIISTVRAFILWHLACVVHFRPGWTIFGVIFYLVFELILFNRPAREQI